MRTYLIKRGEVRLFQDGCRFAKSHSGSAFNLFAKPNRQYNETACFTSSTSTCKTAANCKKNLINSNSN